MHWFLFWRRRGDSPPQKHSRPARLERFALLLVSSPHRLASSATGGALAVRPTPVPARSFELQKNKNQRNALVLILAEKGRLELPRRLPDLRP